MSQRRFDVAGQRLIMRSDRTLHWPRAGILLLADPHFGKGSVFRRQGLGIPAGATRDDLDRLSRALAETGSQRLVILGDFLHAPPAGDEAWLDTFAAWRRRHAALDILVTRGNHDRLASVPDDWALDWRRGTVFEPPFAFRHEPGPVAGAYALAGHWHPVVHLRQGSERLRAPVFWFGAECGVLPAFGRFTGGQPVKPRLGNQLFAVGPETIMHIGIGQRA